MFVRHPDFGGVLGYRGRPLGLYQSDAHRAVPGARPGRLQNSVWSLH